MKINLQDTIANVLACQDKLGAQAGPADLTESKLEQNLLFTIARHQNALDWLIDKHASGKVKLRTRKVLRWALAEIICLDGVPAPHVVDVATAFVKRRYSPHEAGFVNATLRTICSIIQQGTDLFQGAPVHVKFRLPEILWLKWIRQFGEEQAAILAQDILQQASTCLRLRTFPPQMDPTIPRELQKLQPFPWAPGQAFFTTAKQAKLTEILKGKTKFYVQDPATLLPPTMLQPKPGEIIADPCAAPGGKSVAIAEMMKDCGILLASDVNPNKLDTLRENLKPFTCASISQQDATEFKPPSLLDGAILDVPCSNTGVLRRRPDAKWTFSNKKLDELVEIQAKILDNMAKHIKKNGRIVYSTCSIEHDENLAQIQKFLERNQDFILEEHQLILPTTDHDGAFAARLRRR